jgi:hypothetical protein
VAETGAPLWDRHEIGEAYLGGPKD